MVTGHVSSSEDCLFPSPIVAAELSFSAEILLEPPLLSPLTFVFRLYRMLCRGVFHF